ncbi:MAG TPA: M48 family metallopeptidase [Dehalococcoidia bacterium]|nr:M48 family metallopeptidase [Dehalococcoidia bacterium]
MVELALDPRRQEQAREYTRKIRYLLIIDLTLGAIFLLVVLLSGLSDGLRNLLEFHYAATVALYFLVLMLSYSIISAPLSFYRGFILPHRYGLSHQGWRSWLADGAKELFLGLTLGTGIVVVIYLFLRDFTNLWWLLAFAFMIVVTVMMTRMAPILLLPLFFKLEPLSDGELRQRLLALAERCQTRIRDVFQINFSSKTTTGNAMLMGWGGTRRIALSDTLLQEYTPEEIEVIMAHELGHHRHRDIARLIVAQSALMLLGFYLVNLTLRWAVPKLGFDGISDVAALPLLILVLAAFVLVAAPLANAYGRHLERAADRYALTATANPDAFATMLTKLTNQNLTESEPGRWAELLFYDHPPYYKRIELAHKYRSRENE